MKGSTVASLALAAVVALAWTPGARAMAFAPDGSMLPIESSSLSAPQRSVAAASHTSSSKHVRARRHHRRHLVHRKAHATHTGFQEGRGTSPAHPEAPHHPADRRAALPHVTRDHRPPQQNRGHHRGMTAAIRPDLVLSVSTQGLVALEHDSFGNFAGDLASGRGPPRAPPLSSHLRSRPAASAGGPPASHRVPALLASISNSAPPSRPRRVLSAPRTHAPAAGISWFTHPGPPPCVSPAVRVEGATACLEQPSSGGLT